MNIECINSRKWYWHVLADFCLYFGGLVIIVIWKFLRERFGRSQKVAYDENSEPLCNSNKSQLLSVNIKDQHGCYSLSQFYLNRLISTQFITGRIVLLISTIAAALSTMLYIYEICQLPLLLERCFPLRNPIFCIDLACNFIFLIYFLLRFLTSNENIKVWLDFYTFIDFFTITQILTSLILNQEWTGLRFLRVLALMRMPEVMQCFNIITSGTSIRVMQLTILSVSILITGAGFFHLLENSGDLTLTSEYINTQFISYGQSLYFIIVTFSTVGYGDICPKTICGRIFVTIFIILVLATFASFIPELAEFLFARSNYLGKYDKESGRKHVVVCGHINYASVSTFLSDFLHEDRPTHNIDVVFINKKEPDVEMKNLLKIFFTQVKYFQGTVMNQMDLDRVQAATADACLILANQHCKDPNDEDAANIMRAISFKNYCHQSPVIIQLLHFENKTYLQNIPTWCRKNGDQIICYSEIELGILAQSCLVPGFSTLITNLFSVRSEKECKRSTLNERWLNDYMRGVTMEIYSAKLSSYFDDFSYAEVVEFCFKNLNLLLIAVEINNPLTKKKLLLINPTNCPRICHGSVGYFICDSYKDALNASVYCPKCHAVLRDLSVLKQCNCKCTKHDYTIPLIGVELKKDEEEISLNQYDLENEFREMGFMDDNSMKKTGSFYMCYPQKLLKCVISTKHQTESLNNHIILCIFSDKRTTLIGLKNFLMPLRSSSIPEKDLKDLLIIADKDFIEKEWSEICFFPKIKVVFHQISICRIINLLAIERCSRCVLLNSKSNFDDLQNDAYMMDKEIIIANLYFHAESQRQIFKMKSCANLNEFLQKSNIASSENVSKSEFISLNMEAVAAAAAARKSEVHVPIISKLAIESNVQYLDCKEDNSLSLPNYLRKPFAFGFAFTTSMLDSLLSTAYYNQNGIYIMEMLINGGSPETLEKGDCHHENEVDTVTNQFKINLIPVCQINQTINWNNSVFYRDVFMESLQYNASVCLGLYRKRVLCEENDFVEFVDRYVLANPPANFIIDKTDMVYVLQQEKGSSPKKESL